MRFLIFVVLLVTSWPALAQSSQPASRSCSAFFYRDRLFVGSLITAKISEEKSTVGVLSGGSYFVHEVEPGAHTFAVGRRTRTITCRNGEAHYLRLSPVSGLIFARFVLTIEPDDGPAAIDGLKESTGVAPSKKK